MSPSEISFLRIISATGFSINLSNDLLNGLAPYFGSNPCSKIIFFAALFILRTY